MIGSARFLPGSSLPLPLALLLCTACGPIVFQTQMESETTIPGDNTVLGSLLESFPGFAGFDSMDFSTNQELKNRGITREQVDSVTVSDVTLTIRSPSTQDFRFLDTLAFKARAGNLVVPVASKREIAALGLEAPNPSLTLDVTGQELVDIATAPEMSIEVEGSGRRPRQETLVRAVVTLRVEATPF